MARPNRNMNRSKIMVTCLPSSGRGGRFISSSDANQLISEGSAHRINSLTIQLNARDDMPKTDDESCRMGPNATECFADGMEWARALRAGWKPLKDFVIVSAEESQLQQVCAW